VTNFPANWQRTNHCWDNYTGTTVCYTTLRCKTR